MIATASSPADPVAFLATTELFHRLDDRALGELAACFDWLHLSGGETLFRIGEPADALYVVVTGRLRAVIDEVGAGRRVIREIGRGQNVGELALLTDEPRSASVEAIRDSQLGRLSRARFEELITSQPHVMLELTRILARWLSQSNRRRASPNTVATIAVLPIGEEAPLGSFCEALVQSLEQIGRTARVDTSCIRSELAGGVTEAFEGSARHTQLMTWLDACETANSFVVYEGSTGDAGWSRRCLRQADRVLFVAGAHGDVPAAHRALQGLLGEGNSGLGVEELVLVHSEDTEPVVETARWLELRGFANHHHLRHGCRPHFDRLVRHLTGRALGLVLSGGGARGFAHIGVVRALDEAGIPIDRLGGSSMGAVIAAQRACGHDWRTMLEMNRAWSRQDPIRDITLPVVSLLSGRVGTRLLEEMFGARKIEDLWSQYFCVSTNLSRSEIVVHRRGSVARWVRASISIPGVAPPLPMEEGDLLVDGGVLNNLPVDVMRQLGPGPVIAVDVNPAVEFSVGRRGGDLPSIRQLVRDRLSRFGGRKGFGAPKGFPSIYRILERTVLVASLAHTQRMRDEVDLYLDPPVGSVGTFDWAQLDRLVGVGYEFAKQHIMRWQAAVPTV